MRGPRVTNQGTQLHATSRRARPDSARSLLVAPLEIQVNPIDEREGAPSQAGWRKWALLQGVRIINALGGSRVLRRIPGFMRLKRGENGFPQFPYLKVCRTRNVQILTYHRVNDENDQFFPAMPVSVFQSQMEHLSECYLVLPLEEMAKRIEDDDIPDNAVVITFDDGYRDNYTQAFPILRRLLIPATIFLATGVIGTNGVLWHDRVFSAFRLTKKTALIGFFERPSNVELSSQEDKLRAQTRVLKFLRGLHERERDVQICRLLECLAVGSDVEQERIMLNWEEVSHMRREGISFGSHTVTHPILSRLSQEEVEKQVALSSEAIERHACVRPRTFAYPNGTREDFTETTKHVLKEAGYLCAVTTTFGTNAHGQDLFELRRGQPWEHDLDTFAAKMIWYKFAS